MRTCVLGPPASGKSTVIRQLCEHFKLHHIKIQDVIKEAIDDLVCIAFIIFLIIFLFDLRHSSRFLYFEVRDNFFHLIEVHYSQYSQDCFPLTLVTLGNLLVPIASLSFLHHLMMTFEVKSDSASIET